MKVTQEKLPASQIGLEIEISAETSQKTYEKVIKELARSANIPGFRKGKVPRPILLQRLGAKRVKATALEEIIQTSLKEAIEQEEIESIGNPTLSSDFAELIEKYQPGQPFTFSFAVDVPPAIELEDYQNLSIKAEETAYEPAQVDKYLEERRLEQATLIPVEDRPAQMGDVAIADYVGRFVTEEGEEAEAEIPGTKATDLQMELAEGRFIEGMVEGMVGMNLAETRKVSAKFPDNYPREDLAGQEAIFTITLKELKEKELPELDDDFAEDVSNGKFETLAELRESLEAQFKERAELETKNSIHQAIIDKLVQESSLDLPETMIEQEVNLLLTQTAMQMERMGIDPKQMFTSETLPRMRQQTRPDAIGRLKQSLILAEIAKRESLAPEAKAVEAKVQELREQMSDRDIDLERLREMVTEDLQAEKILDWLQEKATVELVAKGSLSQSEEAGEDLPGQG